MNFLQTIFMRAVDRPQGILGRLEVYLCKITETVRKKRPRSYAAGANSAAGSQGGRGEEGDPAVMP
jgi:hypothetical protein